MFKVMEHVAKKERFDLPPEAAKEIAQDANGNLRKALLVLEALRMQSWVIKLVHQLSIRLSTSRPSLSGPLSIAKPDWEVYCHKLADLVLQDQSPERVMVIRTKFYELLSHCIPPTVIMKTVADSIVLKVDEPLKADIMHWAAIYENRMRVGSKKIFHLEAWVVKVMALYKVRDFCYLFGTYWLSPQGYMLGFDIGEFD
jgi:replication factor C subunit 3/5